MVKHAVVAHRRHLDMPEPKRLFTKRDVGIACVFARKSRVLPAEEEAAVERGEAQE